MPIHDLSFFFDCSDSNHPGGGGEGEGRGRDVEAGQGPGDVAEHHPEVPEGEGEHAKWNGGPLGQDQQDVRHDGQV